MLCQVIAKLVEYLYIPNFEFGTRIPTPLHQSGKFGMQDCTYDMISSGLMRRVARVWPEVVNLIEWEHHSCLPISEKLGMQQ